MAKEIWIVGASQGLGLQVARDYARRKRRVVGLGRRPCPAPDLFEAWRQADVTSLDSFEAAIAGLYGEGRGPAVIVYMASTLYQGPLTEAPDAMLRAEIDTNYLGFVRLCQAVAAFKPTGQTVRLVAVASTLGYVGCPSLDGYSASKAALISFARSSRRELAGHRIAVQILSPPHMTDGGADLVGPQPFTKAWAAPRFARAAERGPPERLLGFSNGLMLLMARLARPLAQAIMDGIGADALRRGARRPAV
ncbi:NAD(P)-dependent dehydrogenase (short-subunit alcohol dehydrogenase family) [Caulobacter ginsengisoli]|uniref:NAD(P)-dependent dehydrogenase (Short-subunit alcohol dehydrogenase family) n=1 Tax=Caulobacter ginsengisoli TaxID=400775 RepID=A0ABU0IPE3_9CAUL|nr:SDR family oxidoreductase [Caulobacter ginsengisoli]MDQ0463878.1 NAD(P)-dependent dehydrogenase (short-subunit alcohol dehydrogenase family) [Caulobacter ginsengisoli]